MGATILMYFPFFVRFFWPHLLFLGDLAICRNKYSSPHIKSRHCPNFPSAYISVSNKIHFCPTRGNRRLWEGGGGRCIIFKLRKTRYFPHCPFFFVPPSLFLPFRFWGGPFLCIKWMGGGRESGQSVGKFDGGREGVALPRRRRARGGAFLAYWWGAKGVRDLKLY